jgi:hypothetical protein
MNFIRVESVTAFFDGEKDEFVTITVDKEERKSKDNFLREYKSMIDNMSFSEALHLLKKGYNIARKEWNGEEYLVMMHSPRPIEFNGGHIAHDSYVAQKTIRNTLIPYQYGSRDVLADDWIILK